MKNRRSNQIVFQIVKLVGTTIFVVKYVVVRHNVTIDAQTITNHQKCDGHRIKHAQVTFFVAMVGLQKDTFNNN